MANEETSVTRFAAREELPLLLDKARQFATQYYDSLEQRPVRRRRNRSNGPFALS
jgi:hypothetical protein